MGSSLKPIKQSTRLTFNCDDAKYIHQLYNLGGGADKSHIDVVNSYDILAFRTSLEAMFDQACEKSDVDIISMDMGNRMGFFFSKKQCRMAIARGISFEISYSEGCLEDPSKRKLFLMNAIQLVKCCKGKGLILSSGADSSLTHRSPTDAMLIASLIGISSELAISCLTELPAKCFKHAHQRKVYKGTAEII
jgi:ribonuclease P/MRP protein subunit RPP1